MIRAGIRRAFRLALSGKRGWERDVEDEIKLHLSLRAEQLMARGAKPDDAYHEAVRRFGPLVESRARLVDAARHREQRMQRTEYIADLRQDLAFALRTLRRQKGWTTVAIVTLALGIGATTAVYSVVSSLLLHAVHYRDANRVVVVYQQPTNGNNTGMNVSISPSSPVVLAWTKGSRSFESLQAIATGPIEMRTTGDPVSLVAGRIEPGFPEFAGERPIAGRMFSESDLRENSRVVVLAEGLWRTRFGANPRVIGKAITLDDSSYTVIGVLPATLQAPRVAGPTTDVWVPIDLRNDRLGVSVVGRLRRGADPESARRELDSLYARSINATAGKLPFHASVMPPANRVAFRESLITLAYSVGLVLLVACANVAHLLMARTTARRRELAIRAALGAGRGRVLRQLLTESVLLGTAGGITGVVAGWIGLRAMVALRPPRLDELSGAHLDATTLALALGVTLITSIAFGVMGALQSARDSTHDSLKGSSIRAGGRGGRGRALLVVSEMAISAMLVVGASMLIRSVINLQHADLGFEPKHLYTLSTNIPRGQRRSAIEQAELRRSIVTRLSGQAGVQSVALASTPPSWRSFSVGRFEVEGEPVPAKTATAFIDVNQIGTGFFRTMGIHIARGSDFTDTTQAANQVIVNAAFARKHWAGSPPIGKRVRVTESGTEPWLTIVGVVNDALTSGPGSESSAPMLYTAAADTNASSILVRTDGSANPLVPIQALVHSIDPRVSIGLASVETSISESISAPRFVMLLLSVFTVLALALAAIGLYGVMAYSVAQRTREIGIRIALGATRSRIARGVVLGGVTLSVVGAAVGLGVAAWGTRLIENQLYGVAKTDAVSFGAAIIVLIGAALVASIIPTRRALAVDPMTAIRAD